MSFRPLFLALALIASCSAEHFITLLVDNRKLDYSSPGNLLMTLAKHPSDGSKNSDVGHAWILLESPSEKIEIGYTGETGDQMPTYLVGVSLLMDQEDENPGRYLFETLPDGRLEWGSGGHRPTTAARLPISEEDYALLRHYIDHFQESGYSLAQKNCVSFVVGAAKLINIDLCCRRSLRLPAIFWTDPKYQFLTFDCPELLEQELRHLIAQKKAEDVKQKICLQSQETFSERLRRTLRDLKLLPRRTHRWLQTLFLTY